MSDFKFWKCACGDVHWEDSAPPACPSCDAAESYVEISKEEAGKLLDM
ncbi:MAG: hypothetical protein AABY13_03970 [Nanoarchaeota archaeon]